MSIKYFLGEKTLTIVSGSRPRSIERDHPFFSEIVTIVTDPDPDVEWLETLLDPLSPLRDVRIDGGSIEIQQTTVTRNGEAIPLFLQERIIDAVRAGLPVEPWKLFVERFYSNPSLRSREDLVRFMDRSGLPMTPEGKFLAYKRVTVDYKDCHTRSFDNSIGRTVVIPGGRHKVDSDSSKECSYGLHVCSQGYLRQFYSGEGRIVIVEVDPADVVSVPFDYQDSKARVWRYTVVGEVPLETEKEALEWGVISLDYLNEEALLLVNENISRLTEAMAVAVDEGNEEERAEHEVALADAESLRDRIEAKLEYELLLAEAAAAVASDEDDEDEDEDFPYDEEDDLLYEEMEDSFIATFNEVEEQTHPAPASASKSKLSFGLRKMLSRWTN